MITKREKLNELKKQIKTIEYCMTRMELLNKVLSQEVLDKDTWRICPRDTSLVNFSELEKVRDAYLRSIEWAVQILGQL
jgi:hypothetical protein